MSESKWDWEEQCRVLSELVSDNRFEIEYLRGEVARLTVARGLLLEARFFLRDRDTGQWGIDVERWLASLEERA